jgi:hypothetical protein
MTAHRKSFIIPSQSGNRAALTFAGHWPKSRQRLFQFHTRR